MTPTTKTTTMAQWRRTQKVKVKSKVKERDKARTRSFEAMQAARSKDFCKVFGCYGESRVKPWLRSHVREGLIDFSSDLAVRSNQSLLSSWKTDRSLHQIFHHVPHHTTSGRKYSVRRVSATIHSHCPFL